jgi:hypothetical protein
VVSNEKICIEIKINNDSSFIPVFRSESAANKFIQDKELGDFTAQEFTFEFYDYSNSFSTRYGHVLYLRLFD